MRTAKSGSYDRRVPTNDVRAQALLDEIGELYAILLRISRRVEHDEPMTATQRLALVEVAVVGPMRLQDLAARMDTTPATASRAVDALEEHRFAARRPDPNDGRAIQIVATAKGKRWSERRRAQLHDLLADLPANVATPRLAADIARLNAALREATGHGDVARGTLLAP
jgi:DNA-binding MarR family transcriptional regulator